MESSRIIGKVVVSEVTKLFGAKRALCNVSLDVSPGEVVALIGKNGAGKSTLLSILSTMMKPTFGTVQINGAPATAESRAHIGYLSHKPFVYPELSCEENLKLFASLYNVGDDAVQKMKTQFRLDEFFSNRPVGVLSRGQLQRAALARTLLAAPDVLLLDEPASGLDRGAIGLIEQLVAEHRDKAGITFIVSHDPALVAEVSTRVVLLQMGEVAHETGRCSSDDILTMLVEGV
ncbi:MAG: heme ABC exporter ATP-binding protein CcmA [Deltaproteobacteria bacterium]|nr:heme ABC exporter ATP-binding protein CcmA [Deltaproteobacteria bacterium]MBN2673798.1 heme ABC exporter ATP-binding protein CcmA [Deltaproteobacteria bacterium]